MKETFFYKNKVKQQYWEIFKLKYKVIKNYILMYCKRTYSCEGIKNWCNNLILSMYYGVKWKQIIAGYQFKL